jgi:hypothetical protein
MSNRNFSDVLDAMCRSAGLDPQMAAPRQAHRILRNTASRLQSVTDRILDIASRAQSFAFSSDAYLEQQRESAPRRPQSRPNDPGAVAAELSISAEMTLSDLTRLRRTFALANHPDRAHPLERDSATRRMMIANMLIDRELKRRAPPANSLRK